MEQTTQDNRFFTNDLYPEDGEVGNAFWGKNIANNFTRLLAMGGTVAFAQVGMDEETDEAKRINFPVSLAHSEFRSAPIVQLWVKSYQPGQAEMLTDHPSHVEAYFDGVILTIRYMGKTPEQHALVNYRIFGV